MKTKITLTKNGTVLLSYDDAILDERREREFMAPLGGGYVREWIRGDWQQVCEGLSGTGNTLYCHDHNHLIAMIRHEYKAMRRFEKKWQYFIK